MPAAARVLKMVTVVVSLCIALGVAAWCIHYNGDALWRIISQQCIPDQQDKHNPGPCQQVDFAHGFVTLKDRNGPLQYLLMPVAHISGIENPALLTGAVPDFFALAWQQRSLLSMRRGAVVPDSAVLLSVNSEYGRTQNQLHVHISCLRPDVRQTLDRLAPQLDQRWQSFSVATHRWLIRALTPVELTQQSSFIRLSQEVPQAQQEMGKYGLALASLPDGRLALMAIKRNWLKMNRGSAEELQDHSCAILPPER